MIIFHNMNMINKLVMFLDSYIDNILIIKYNNNSHNRIRNIGKNMVVK